MELLDKESYLDALVVFVLAERWHQSLFAQPVDFNYEIIELCKALQKYGVTLDDVETAIKYKDFTNQLTSYGSGDRERGFVMEYLEGLWDSALQLSNAEDIKDNDNDLGIFY